MLSELYNVHKSSSLRGGQNKINSNNQTRKFSTSTKFNPNNQTRGFSSESSIDNNDNFIDLDQTPAGISSNKQALKKFKKVFGGGYLGYKIVHHFGSVLFDPRYKISYTIPDLENKLIEYLNNIPDTVVYSVLPFIRWHTPKGNYQTLNTSKSIKITRNSSRELIAEKLEMDLNKMLQIYELADSNLDFYVMSRPWLKKDAFDIDEAGLTHIFNEQLEREVSYWLKQKDLESLTKKSSEKADSLKNYPYKNVFMDNYGDPIFGINNNLIGYKLNARDCASIETYYNN